MRTGTFCLVFGNLKGDRYAKKSLECLEQIRNPNIEIRNAKKIQITKEENSEPDFRFPFFFFEFWICFGFRISDLISDLTRVSRTVLAEPPGQVAT
jgi:hypothetical protein